jgi:hypothetical protein
MDTGLVVAFADTPRARETLAVLLERECELQFLPASAVATAQCGAAALALVALERDATFAQNLRRHWPLLPIVAVDAPPGSGPRPAVPLTPAAPNVVAVPFEPYALREAVLQRLRPDRDRRLGATIRLMVETLRAELTYTCAALRVFSRLYATSVGVETYAVLAAVLREQTRVLRDTVAQLHRFRCRPRTGALSPRFSSALGERLERPDRLARTRGLVCTHTVDATCPVPGPLMLVPLLAGLLRAHAVQRSATPLVGVRVTSQGVRLRYRRRPDLGRGRRSWPLLLATCAVEPWCWSLTSVEEEGDEVVSLQPTT